MRKSTRKLTSSSGVLGFSGAGGFKHREAQLARKAEENAEIQAEMERVKARYPERLRRNLDGMTREKAAFGNWLTLKQQEAQSMAEAVDQIVSAAQSRTSQSHPAALLASLALVSRRSCRLSWATLHFCVAVRRMP